MEEDNFAWLASISLLLSYLYEQLVCYLQLADNKRAFSLI
jgi:hypothetical protein